MKRTPITVRYILSVYVTGLLFFTFFRCLLVYTNAASLHSIPAVWGILFHTMFMGLRFDTVVSGYVLILPATILLVSELLNLLKRPVILAAHIFICALYTAAFFICAADIPFFKNYNNRLNVSILNWIDSPLFMVRMVWEDNSFLAYFFLFIITAVLFIMIATHRYKKFIGHVINPGTHQQAKVIYRAAACVLLPGLMVLGMRGRTDEKSPIIAGTAYFCNYDLPNQAGLNPVFTFMWSWTDELKDENRKLTLMDDSAALQNVRYYLHIEPGQGNKEYPICRNVATGVPEHKYNVVVVVMESMSAYYMARFGNKNNLTPNLDTLAAKGYSFDNFYSAGIHTFNGIFSVLYAYPALMARHTMEGAIIHSYTGLPMFFRQRGYETMYFTTHDDQFDNVGGFLSANNVHKIISKKDYPSSEVLSTLGVPDHVMLGFSIPKLNECYSQHKPFLAMYMTASNHNPFIVPGNVPFKANHPEVRGGCVEYADWAIGNFMKQAETQPWFANTIFVFVADHGAGEGICYEGLPLAYNHIPCIIYAPMLLDSPRVIKSPGGQIDIFPTIAGLEGGSYTNNTLGIDLLRDSRPYMYFSQDDKVAVANTTQLYIWRKSGPESLLGLADGKEYLPNNRAMADSMKQYAFSMIQTAQWMLYNKKTGAQVNEH